MKRRQFMAAGLGAGLAALTAPLRAEPLPVVPVRRTPRVVIVGGGWGGLAAARALRQWAPSLEILLIERQPAFIPLPLSNRWLVGLSAAELARYDYADLARRGGFTYVPATVEDIDRRRRQVVTATQRLDYDWLVLAVGIREDDRAWFGDDVAAASECRTRFASGFTGGEDLLRLKARLANFSGGNLLMTLPPLPYRCPPAPYERAVMLAWWLKEKRIKARLLVLDPNPPVMAFDRVFRDTYSDQISYFPQARILSVDPFKKQIVTDFETLDFSEALLAPPQQAASLAWQAGLVEAGTTISDGAGQGKASAWAAVDPVHLHVPGDERVFLIGDMIDKVSPLFGFYPKTGEIALRQGQAVAASIAQQHTGSSAMTRTLPSSRCFVVRRVSPLEISRLDSEYRFRGDGLIQQSVKQMHYAQADDEDVRWMTAIQAELGL